jgi:hypothetical protein
MYQNSGYHDISNIDIDFKLPEQEPELCEFAQFFNSWVEWLFDEIISEKPSVIAVNQAKILLADKYFDWRTLVPKSHRNHISYRGHNCIFQIFVQAYDRIKLVELSLTPPMLFIPPEPHIDGTLIGLLDE